MQPRSRSAEVWQLALPIIGGMTSQNLLNLADAWMVGGLGAAALAGVGMANFINFIAFAASARVAPAKSRCRSTAGCCCRC